MEVLTREADTVFCAMDFSGDQKSGNYKYLAIVACTEEFLNSLVSSAGLEGTGRSQADKKDRRMSILSKLDASRPGCFALCVKTDKGTILSRITETAQLRKRVPKKEDLAYTYNNTIMECIREDLDRFLKLHKQSLPEIVVEADHDCKELLKHINIQQTEEAHAHMVADTIAWSNNRGDEPPGVRSLDITTHLYNKLKIKFGKRKRRVKQRRQ